MLAAFELLIAHMLSFVSNLEGIHANEGDSSCMRFIARVLQWLLGGFTAKDKTVRYRCISIVAELVARLNIFEFVAVFPEWGYRH